MSRSNFLPAVSSDTGLAGYLQEIRKFPLLEADEEYMLAKAWVDYQDSDSAQKLITSHLRLAARIAMGYRGYGLPMGEIVSEANVGLMQAVKRFDPDKGFRLSTYAMWWIRAAIQEYVLRSWSLVKIGTTSAQKKLFFNLRKAKVRIGALEDQELHPDKIKLLAQQFSVTEKDIIDMDRRISGGDASLNAPISSQEGDGGSWIDWVEDESTNTEQDYAEADEHDTRLVLLDQAMSVLNEREAEILRARRLNDEPLTLDDLSKRYDISRERVRQIEVRAFEKLAQRMKELAIQKNMLEEV